MVSPNRILVSGLPIVLLILVSIAGYGYSQIRYLSLPISPILAVFTILLPIVTGISIQSARCLLQFHATNLGRSRPTLYLILLLVFQLIYETFVATLALTHMAPPSSLHCGLEDQWKRLWMNKDGTAIKRIQDTFDCCGFGTLADRAWPFPRKGVDARECQTRFNRTQSCAGPWRQAEQINAGLLLIVAAIIFVMKLLALIAIFNTSTAANTIPWYQSSLFNRVAAGEVEDRRRLIEEGEPQRAYRDEVETGGAGDGETTANGTGINGNRPRIEPSALHGTEGWRDEH